MSWVNIVRPAMNIAEHIAHELTLRAKDNQIRNEALARDSNLF